MKRRDFLKTSAAGAAIIFIPGMGFFSCTKNSIEPTVDAIRTRFISPPDMPEEEGGFYVQFINGREYAPTDLELNNWRLKLTQTKNGDVIRQKELPFDDIMNLFDTEEESFFKTFQCVGNTPGGYQISNGYFSGVPLRRYLEDQLDVDWNEAKRVYFRCYDGYHTNHTKERIMSNTLPPVYLVYKFDGIPFNDRRMGSLQHGYPVRLVVPEMLGMKSPKAIMEIEVSDRDEVDGYWESRPISSNFPNVHWADIPLMKVNSRIYDPVNFQMMRTGSTYKVRGIAFGGMDPQSGEKAPLKIMEIGIAEAPNRIVFGNRTYKEATIRPRAMDAVRPEYDNSGEMDFENALSRFSNPDDWTNTFVWNLWEFDLKVPNDKGMYRLFARATDLADNSQPLEEDDPAEIRDGNNGQHSIIIQAE